MDSISGYSTGDHGVVLFPVDRFALRMIPWRLHVNRQLSVMERRGGTRIGLYIDTGLSRVDA